jgi:hypothetical protein
MRPRQNFAQRTRAAPKIPAPHRYVISVNALLKPEYDRVKLKIPVRGLRRSATVYQKLKCAAFK